jgi:hypothetical protein
MALGKQLAFVHESKDHTPTEFGAVFRCNENNDSTDRVFLSSLIEGPNTERILHMHRYLYLDVQRNAPRLQTLQLGSYGGPLGGAFSYGRGTPVGS